jgi:AraC-like DNA-binding protein
VTCSAPGASGDRSLGVEGPSGQSAPSAGPPARLVISPGYASYLGPALDIDAHSTAVGCLAIGLDAPLTFRAAAIGEIIARSVYARARHVHQLTAGQGRMLVLLLEPTSASIVDYQTNMKRVSGPFGFDHHHEHHLIAACQSGEIDFDALLTIAGTPRSGSIDPRIARVIRSIRVDPLTNTVADAVAEKEGLSTSYFLRLFTQQTGTSFRRYKAWSRMLHAANGFSAGNDLTRCAADAGFASLSHFSRVFHSMFGLSATALLAVGLQVVTDQHVGSDANKTLGLLTLRNATPARTAVKSAMSKR